VRVFIKNMTTPHSRLVIKDIIEDLGLHIISFDAGEIEIQETLSHQAFQTLKEKLHQDNFEIVDDKETIITEKIGNVIVEMIHFSDELPVVKYSNYISNKLRKNYTYLSKIFSKVRKTTIEHFIIVHKIERVKQFLLYDNLTLSEIALRLHYSSPAHLSSQFKKVTGITPSRFKKSKSKGLITIENAK